jgi:hypothetical protein
LTIIKGSIRVWVEQFSTAEGGILVNRETGIAIEAYRKVLKSDAKLQLAEAALSRAVLHPDLDSDEYVRCTIEIDKVAEAFAETVSAGELRESTLAMYLSRYFAVAGRA